MKQTPVSDVDDVRQRPHVVLPVLALLLVLGAGYLKFIDGTARSSATAASTSMQAARDSAVALLSYRPDTVEKQLGAAKNRLTGAFLDSYSSLITDVVIPGAKQQQISATATIPGAASVSASADHAEVLLFIDQQVVVGHDALSATHSTVLATMDNVDGRWLISDFQPK